MNIKEAKEQIRNAMKAYFTKDEFGNFVIPPEEQRPLFLMGPPGIGKTAIMKQIAGEMGAGLVSYSMTHHTRQSALGLPVITERCFDGVACKITEYTMSEIIASVYDMIAASGTREGILFLDEINCVSETLTPTMLQFLQFKTFGKHAVPGGWIVVTAGNPPEYNRSVREFDVVTWDRLKRIDIEPDYQAWKEYALSRGVHPAVTTYLDAKKENFYRIEADADGKRFVTARGWVDLSDMIRLYEMNSIPVDGKLVSQYLQDREIAEDFAVYYDLFNKYKSDYRIDQILSGKAPGDIVKRASEAPFDERLSLIGLLLDSAFASIRGVVETEDVITALRDILREVKAGASAERMLSEQKERMRREELRGSMNNEKRRYYERITAFLSGHVQSGSSFDAMRDDYLSAVAGMRTGAAAEKDRLEYLFAFAEKAWGEGQETLVIVTEATINIHTARFIARYGCDAYYRHNEALMFYERETEIIRRMEQIENDGL